MIRLEDAGVGKKKEITPQDSRHVLPGSRMLLQRRGLRTFSNLVQRQSSCASRRMRSALSALTALLDPDQSEAESSLQSSPSLVQRQKVTAQGRTGSAPAARRHRGAHSRAQRTGLSVSWRKLIMTLQIQRDKVSFLVSFLCLHLCP